MDQSHYLQLTPLLLTAALWSRSCGKDKRLLKVTHNYHLLESDLKPYFLGLDAFLIKSYIASHWEAILDNGKKGRLVLCSLIGHLLTHATCKSRLYIYSKRMKNKKRSERNSEQMEITLYFHCLLGRMHSALVCWVDTIQSRRSVCFQ